MSIRMPERVFTAQTNMERSYLAYIKSNNLHMVLDPGPKCITPAQEPYSFQDVSKLIEFKRRRTAVADGRRAQERERVKAMVLER